MWDAVEIWRGHLKAGLQIGWRWWCVELGRWGRRTLHCVRPVGRPWWDWGGTDRSLASPADPTAGAAALSQAAEAHYCTNNRNGKIRKFLLLLHSSVMWKIRRRKNSKLWILLQAKQEAPVQKVQSRSTQRDQQHACELIFWIGIEVWCPAVN